MRARSHSLRRGGATALALGLVLSQASSASAGALSDGAAVPEAARSVATAALAPSPVPPGPAAKPTPAESSGRGEVAAPVASKAPESGRPSKAAAEPDDKGIDPEPDVAIKPPPVTLGADPLDAGPAKPAEAAAPASDPLPALNAAIKRALDKRAALVIRGPNAAERRKERDAIGFFYLAHAFAPVWSADGAALPATAAVLARLAQRG